MRLEQHRTLWGVLDISDGPLAKSPHHEFEDLIPVLAELGYDGIELPFKMCLGIGPEKIKNLLNRYNMRLTCMVFTDNVVVPGDPDGGFLWGGPYEGYSAPTTQKEMVAALAERSALHESAIGESYDSVEKKLSPLQQKVVDTHLRVFQEQVENAYRLFGDRKKDGGLPTLCVSHSLRDHFTTEMGAVWFERALAWEEERGFTVAHETHRMRFLYSPFGARDFFLKYPAIHKKIKICADLSHWVNVAETDPSDPVLDAAVDVILPNVIHTHCRVGYAQGPQVSDPRAPEWLPHTEGHERWWDRIWASQKARGMEYTTMIAEHGPPTYQQCAPGTKEPLANIWDVNHWIHLRRQSRFASLFGDTGETSKLVPSQTLGADPLTQPPEVNGDLGHASTKRLRIE